MSSPVIHCVHPHFGKGDLAPRHADAAYLGVRDGKVSEALCLQHFIIRSRDDDPAWLLLDRDEFGQIRVTTGDDAMTHWLRLKIATAFLGEVDYFDVSPVGIDRPTLRRLAAKAARTKPVGSGNSEGYRCTIRWLRAAKAYRVTVHYREVNGRLIAATAAQVRAEARLQERAAEIRAARRTPPRTSDS